MRAAHTSVLRETDTTVRRELARFDLATVASTRRPYSRRCSSVMDALQVLDLRNAFSDEDDQRDIRYPADPGIANHLWIE